jgi:hypothetical protein
MRRSDMAVSDPRISETRTWHVVRGQEGSWEIFRPDGSRVASFDERHDAEDIAKGEADEFGHNVVVWENRTEYLAWRRESGRVTG